MQRIIEMTIDYTRQRKAFGKSILDNQVSFIVYVLNKPWNTFRADLQA